jgi:hypothetical protein
MSTETDAQAADWQALAEAMRPCPRKDAPLHPHPSCYACKRGFHEPDDQCSHCDGAGEVPWFDGMRQPCGPRAHHDGSECPGWHPYPYSLELLLKVAVEAGFRWRGTWKRGWEFWTPEQPSTYDQKGEKSPVHALLLAVEAADPDAGLEVRPEVLAQLEASRAKPRSAYVTHEEMRRKMKDTHGS